MAKYDLEPEIKIMHYKEAWRGYPSIIKAIKEKVRTFGREDVTIAVEEYPGVDNEEIERELITKLNPDRAIFADDLAADGEQMSERVKDTLTDDRVFGILSHYRLEQFFPDLSRLQQSFNQPSGLTIIYGTGASVLVPDPDLLIYCDLARWEIQRRYRAGMPNWKMNNRHQDILRKYKRGFFFEWRMADRQKMKIFDCIDFLLDTNTGDDPKMVSGADYREALREVVHRPFRVVPYFDASVWGGQWMKEHYGLDPEVPNYGWAFDGVPEENSLFLRFGEVRVEVPSINLVQQFPDELLGPEVHARFGEEFPIRFDYLDTMGGGNLSLQVHPLTEYIEDKYGMHYTQDESYYILQSTDRSSIYLGLKDDVRKEDLMNDLRKAQTGAVRFPDEKYINRFPVKKHDHYSIPAGTVHCGGRDTVVLEISATPYIFTFKLWDWGRTGLDGKPRPIHLDDGGRNIQMSRNTEWVRKNLVNPFVTLKKSKGETVERTGLHQLEFIETHRHWFQKTGFFETHNSVNMLNLVEGDTAAVESLDNNFEPFEIHYGETFIVPANIERFIIRNRKPNGKEIAVIQAFVRK
ncbi:class I mannose-6-phosphate isomerase [Sporolactobacillus sp. KGMB 08714]|uniref:class I mannose-6-phosphate isomerase n=1 Tax=Sporolactobacillus sp. KGMB 08714 TaxID=3064704 RepID=UPI002FBE5706